VATIRLQRRVCSPAHAGIIQAERVRNACSMHPFERDQSKWVMPRIRRGPPSPIWDQPPAVRPIRHMSDCSRKSRESISDPRIFDPPPNASLAAAGIDPSSWSSSPTRWRATPRIWRSIVDDDRVAESRHAARLAGIDLSASTSEVLPLDQRTSTPRTWGSTSDPTGRSLNDSITPHERDRPVHGEGAITHRTSPAVGDQPH
jgi:hypothetical protein